MSADFTEVPDALRAERRWVGWNLQKRPGKKDTKVPCKAGNCAPASSTDPATWGTFDAAVAGVEAGTHQGIGYCFDGSGRAGIDLDDAIVADGSVRPWARDILRHAQELGVYVERSVSGSGLHFIGRGTCPTGGHNTRREEGGVEWYSTGRYFTVSGDVSGGLGGDPDAHIQELIDRLERELLAAVPGVPLDAAELAMRMRSQELLVEAAGVDAEEAVRAFKRRAGKEMLAAWDRVECDGQSEERQKLLTRIAKDVGCDPVLAAAVFSHSPRFAAECQRGKMPRLLGHEVGKGVAFAKEWSAKEGPPAATRPVLVPLDESGPLRPMPSLIRGVLPADAVGMLWGEPGSFKSFVAIDWGLCVASGTPWLGHAVKRGTVWYLAGEGQAGLRHRVAAWRTARGYDGSLSFLHTQRPILLDEEHGESPGLRSLLDLIEAGEVPALIIVDTLARSMAGDESATKDASRYVVALDALVAAVRRAGKTCTVLLVHHSRKDGDVYRGSSVLRGAADFEYEAKKCASDRLALECHKVKDGSAPPSLALRVEPVLLGDAVDDFGETVGMSSLVLWMDRAERDPAEPIRAKAQALLPSIRQALAQFPNGTSRRGLEGALKAAGVKFDKGTVGALIEFLEQDGSLVVERRGQALRIRLGV